MGELLNHVWLERHLMLLLGGEIVRWVDGLLAVIRAEPAKRGISGLLNQHDSPRLTEALLGPKYVAWIDPVPQRQKPLTQEEGDQEGETYGAERSVL